MIRYKVMLDSLVNEGKDEKHQEELKNYPTSNRK